MTKSLLRYLNYFFVTLFLRTERKILIRDFMWFFSLKRRVYHDYDSAKKQISLHAAANWLINNQQYNSDRGFSTYRIVEGHTSSYPETSGYIIDSLFSYADKWNRREVIPELFRCADWLLEVQRPSGGWPSGYINENKSEVVFNTGQVIRGLLKAYSQSRESKYLHACERAGNWLCEIQEKDGSWKKFAFMNVQRVYETYVSAPLLDLWKVTGNELYKNAAVKNIDWVIQNKMQENGWLEDCDNTIRHNERPILHTIAYTLDGILDCAVILDESFYVEKVQISADALLRIFTERNYLGGRYDRRWNTTESLICTGGAQISIVWMKLYKITGESRYLNAAQKMNSLLCFVQSATFTLRREVNGALQGSFPLWGRYEPFAFPNWATKYLLDALMLEKELL